MVKGSTVSRNHAVELLRFAASHKFVVNPAGYKYYTDGFLKFGCCPCDKTRLSCPCEQAVDEITSLGKCKCQLFWRDYETYLTEKF